MSGFDSIVQSAVRWDTAGWFEGYSRITNKRGELVRPVANVHQKRLNAVIKHAHDTGRPCRIVALKPRQKGSSTFAVAAGHCRLKAKRGNGLIAGGKHFQGANLFRILDTYSKNDELDSKACKVMDMEARYSNGSHMQRITLANGDAGRSGTYQFLTVTEASFLSDEGVANADDVLDGLLKCVPLESDTIVIIESTANGGTGYFYDMWNGGITYDEFLAGRQGYVKVFSAWFEFDDSRLKPESEGIHTRDDLTETERAYADKWGLDLEQMAWFRYALRDECKGDFDKFQQDYPSDPQTAFLKSGRGRFDSSAIAYQERLCGLQSPEYGILEYNDKAQRVSFRATSESEARVVRYESAVPGRRYIAGCDPSTGDSQTSGLDPDSNAYGVMRAGYLDHNGRWREPALAMRNMCYHDGNRFGNWYDTDIVEEELVRMSQLYGNCKVVVEANKDRGLIELMKMRGGVDIYQREMFNKREQKTMSAYGWETNQQTRERIISTLAQALRESGNGNVGGGIEVRCRWIVSELQNFVTKASGRSEAASGKHDDGIFFIAICLQLIEQATPYFEEMRPEWLPRDLRNLRQSVAGVGPRTFA